MKGARTPAAQVDAEVRPELAAGLAPAWLGLAGQSRLSATAPTCHAATPRAWRSGRGLAVARGGSRAQRPPAVSRKTQHRGRSAAMASPIPRAKQAGRGDGGALHCPWLSEKYS